MNNITLSMIIHRSCFQVTIQSPAISSLPDNIEQECIFLYSHNCPPCQHHHHETWCWWHSFHRVLWNVTNLIYHLSEWQLSYDASIPWNETTCPASQVVHLWAILPNNITKYIKERRLHVTPSILLSCVWHSYLHVFK